MLTNKRFIVLSLALFALLAGLWLNNRRSGVVSPSTSESTAAAVASALPSEKDLPSQETSHASLLRRPAVLSFGQHGEVVLGDVPAG